MAKNKSQYDSTLNLPKTLFEMRAGLPKKEPVMLKDWDDNDLYNQLMKHNEAICLNGQFEYSFVKIGEEYHIMATDLVKSVMDACHIENYEVVGEPVSGAEF